MYSAISLNNKIQIKKSLTLDNRTSELIYLERRGRSPRRDVSNRKGYQNLLVARKTKHLPSKCLDLRYGRYYLTTSWVAVDTAQHLLAIKEASVLLKLISFKHKRKWINTSDSLQHATENIIQQFNKICH